MIKRLRLLDFVALRLLDFVALRLQDFVALRLLDFVAVTNLSPDIQMKQTNSKRCCNYPSHLWYAGCKNSIPIFKSNFPVKTYSK